MLQADSTSMINKQADDLVHNHGFKPDDALQHALIADAMFRDALADEYQWLDEYYEEHYSEVLPSDHPVVQGMQ